MSTNVQLKQEAAIYGNLNVYCKILFSDIEDIKAYLPSELNYQPSAHVPHIVKVRSRLIEIKDLADMILEELNTIDARHAGIPDQFPANKTPGYETLSDMIEREKGMS